MIRGLAYAFLIAAVLVIAGFTPAKAEQSKTFGHYTIHYNAFSGDILTPEVAKSYSIKRRNNKAVVNITLHDKDMKPVKAKINGYAVNLSNQLKSLEFKEVLDGAAVYYIAQSQVANKETLIFTIKVSPANENFTARIKFKQKFYTD